MGESPSIFVLRNTTDPLPPREDLSPGDFVILVSGDVLVFTGLMWDLLPGRYLDIDELKEFVTYVASGWPEDSDIARLDMRGKVPDTFLERMLQVVKNIQKYCLTSPHYS
jgi:hypothetical protein